MKFIRFFYFLLLTSLLVCSQANATVVDWNYTIQGAFTSWTIGGTTDSGSETTLSWGTSTGDGQSSLVIDPYEIINQPVTTYVGAGTPDSSFWAESLTLTHNNNPITGGTLTNAFLSVTVDLTPTTPVAPGLPQQSFTFNIGFEETTNTGSGLPEEWDIFTILGGFQNFNFNYNDVTQVFKNDGTGDGQDYFVNLFPSDGSVLSTLPDGSLGFMTPEGQSTELPFVFTITTEPLNTIPEPGTFLLVGLGLLGFARAGRKK